MEKEGFAYLKETFGPLHWELLLKCFEHDLRFSREALGMLARYIRNPLAKKIATAFISMGMEVVDEVKDEFIRDPYGLLEKAARVNVFSAGLRDLVSLVRWRLRMAVAHVGRA